MRVLFLGGGTLGHVIPNLAVIEEIRSRSLKHQILYIGERGGVERSAVKKFDEKIQVKEVWCGKLRRYFSIRNFLDFFKVPVGILQSLFIVSRFNPQVVFSKGGYASVPGIVAAGVLNFFRSKENKIKIYVHESDAKQF